MDAADREFLPVARQVYTTPPSPVRMRLMLSICALFACALLISWIGKIDIYATAPARIQPSGRSKVIQPLDAGRVRAIFVANGSQVHIGDLLLELETTETDADRKSSAGQVASLSAEISRRLHADTIVRAKTLVNLPRVTFEADVDPAIQQREQAVLAADVGQLRAGLELLDAKIEENVAHKTALEDSILQENHLIETLRERLVMRQGLEEKGLESKANVLDALEGLQKELTSFANQSGTLRQTIATINSQRREKSETIAKFIASNAEALSTVQAKHAELLQVLVKAVAKVDHTRLTAPIEGTVQELAVTTIGQVVSPGQQLMIVVPASARLEAEALVSNKDIGFIHLGQSVVLKLDAFPYTRYGTLSGTVARISHDAVGHSEAATASNSAAPAVAPERSGASPTPQVQDLVFPVTILLDRVTMLAGKDETPLSAGMTAFVDIRTGDRRVLDFVLSPLTEVTSTAARER